MNKKFKKDDWLNIVNGILDTVSEFAHNAADNIMRDDETQKQYKRSFVDYNKIAETVAENKVKWWKIAVKYILGAVLLIPAAALFSTSLMLSWLPRYLLLAVSAMFFVPSVVLLLSAGKDSYLKKIIKQYIPVIGMRPEAGIGFLSDALYKKPQKIKKDVSRLLRAGVFPDVAYYDKRLDILVLDGYRQPEEEKSEPATDPKKNQYDLDFWIKKLNMLNLEIRNFDVAAKLEILADYVEKMRGYVAKNPEREKQLRTFVNYYLPTTVKLMESYKTIENMGDVGDNVKETKLKIENSLDTLISAYKNQLETLYSAEAMDISGDIDVLETMMKRDGLGK